MRKLDVELQGYPGNCGIEVLYGFPHVHKQPYDGSMDTRPLRREEWFFMLDTVLINDGLELPALLSFSHSHTDNKGVGSPERMAKWLKGRGEKVTTSQTVRNPNSGNNITVYFWAPSKKFRIEFEKYQNKRDDERDEDDGDIW